MFSGTTTASGSAFDRPVANGTAAPTALSDDATAAPYSAQTFTVTATGTYDLVSTATTAGQTTALWDNFVVLYTGTFSASAPLTNAVVADDDDNAPNVGTSALLGVSLTAGQTYTLVTTGASNADHGTFATTVSPSATLQAGTTVGGPTGDPFGTGEAVPYSVVSFTVAATGNYAFLSSATSSFDNFLALYGGTFAPTDSSANLVDSNDNNPSAATRSGFANVPLAAGTTYYLVTTGTAAAQSGAFVNTVSGPGTFAVLS